MRIVFLRQITRITARNDLHDRNRACVKIRRPWNLNFLKCNTSTRKKNVIILETNHNGQKCYEHNLTRRTAEKSYLRSLTRYEQTYVPVTRENYQCVLGPQKTCTAPSNRDSTRERSADGGPKPCGSEYGPLQTRARNTQRKRFE